MTVTITGVHPYAEKFPMLPDTELAELAGSIAQNGLRQTIVITPDGLILDGRNRYAACQQIGVEPTTTIYDGDDLAEFVIDCNSSRRHMSTGARAMSTALVLAADGRRENGRWVGWSRTSQDSGKSSGEREALRVSGIILDHAPALAERVVTGDLALDAAYRQATDARDAEARRIAEQEEIAAKEAEAEEFVKANAPDLAAQVPNPFLTFSEALAVWEQRNRDEAKKRAAAKAEAERADREREHGIRTTVQATTDRIYSLAAQDPAIYLKNFHPHEHRLVSPSMRLTADRLDKVIHFLTELRKAIA